MSPNNSHHSVSATELLDRPFGLFDASAFHAALFDDDQSFWWGGISVAGGKDSAGKMVWKPKTGLFFIPNPIREPRLVFESLPEGHVLPWGLSSLSADDSSKFKIGKVTGADIGPIQTVFGESDSGSVEEQLTRILGSGVPYTALVLSGDNRKNVLDKHQNPMVVEAGRSVHVFVRLEESIETALGSASESEVEEIRIRAQYALMAGLGQPDTSAKDRARRMRFGGVCTRQSGAFEQFGNKFRYQTCLDIAPRLSIDSFVEWIERANASLPSDLLRMRDRDLSAASGKIQRAAAVTVPQALGRLAPTSSDAAKKRLGAACAQIEASKEGKRNEILNKAAFEIGGWIASGALDEQEARAALTESSLKIGLSDEEIETTITRTFEKGAEQPLGFMTEAEANLYDAVTEEQRESVRTALKEFCRELMFGGEETPDEVKTLREKKKSEGSVKLKDVENRISLCRAKESRLTAKIGKTRQEIKHAVDETRVGKLEEEVNNLIQEKDGVKRVLRQLEKEKAGVLAAINDAENLEIDPRVELRRNDTTGKPDKNSLTVNAAEILNKDINYGEKVWYDEFKSVVMIDAEEVTDVIETNIALDLQRRYGIGDISTSKISELLKAQAMRQRRHPVKEWLRELKWDGQSRLGQLLEEGFGARVEPGTEDYLAEVGTKIMISAAARVLEPRRREDGELEGGPGCKVDTMMVLVGPEGLKKSTCYAKLVPDTSWFGASQLEIGNKDAYGQMQGKWIYEIQELDSQTTIKNNPVIKGFLSTFNDRYRPAYGRHTIDHRRQTILVGSTNRDEFIESDTGARRYIVVQVDKIGNLDWIINNRNQLWAEAVAMYDSGASWWWDTGTEEDIRRNEIVKSSITSDAWETNIRNYLKSVEFKPDGVSLSELLENAVFVSASNMDRGKQSRMGHVLINAFKACRNTKTKNYVIPKEFYRAEKPKVVVDNTGSGSDSGASKAASKTLGPKLVEVM